MRGDDFFAGRRAPELTFRSTGVELRDDGSAVVDGRAHRPRDHAPRDSRGQLPGTDRRIRSAPCGRRSRCTRRVDRRDWGLSWQLPLPDGGDAVGWEVELTAELELVEAA